LLFDNPLIEQTDRSDIMEFTPVIMVHLVTAVAALVMGGVMLAMRKGTRMHRLVGRTWVALMLTTALVSFGIRSGGHFSWIHLLSVSALAGLALAIYAVMKGRIARHRRVMIAVYAGLVIAGSFALLPDRRLGYLVWHAVGIV
jgi:uncharacterized membrane protein